MGKVTQEQADKFGISLSELKTLAEGKDCSVYPGETLHVRRTKGGKVTVFNTSEKARGEKISATKQTRKVNKENTDNELPAEAV
jgi:hypothetical protein